ncbi:hypothetical protein ACFLZF_00200 [Nanoarchaeota archaeon]
MKMKTKNLMVFFLAIVSMFALVATTSAYTGAFAGGNLIEDAATIKVDGVVVEENSPVGVIAGETIDVKVYFTSMVDASNVRIKASLNGEKVDIDEKTGLFDVEDGSKYSKSLTLTIPSGLSDEISDDIELTLKVWNGDYRSESEVITLRAQRPTYKTEIKHVSFSQTIDAGETLPVEIVIENEGYNKLEDLYVSVDIPELGIAKTSYFGDLVALESLSNNDEDEEIVRGKIYLNIPYDIEEGIYTLEISISNDDIDTNLAKQIVINNEFSDGRVIKNDDSLLIVNPTNKLKIYRVVLPNSEKYVTISAGTSRTISMDDSSDEYTVSVLTMDGEVIKTFTFGGNTSSAVAVLTIILVIVFIVLVIVLIVLVMGKKSEKTEDLTESYY